VAAGAAFFGEYLAAETRQLHGRKDRPRGLASREVLPMSEVIPFPPKPPPKTIAEETAEFLKLLERIRSESRKSK
jgi:hypothetical protein